MFELSIAWKYLLPRRKRLSASIISLISTFVIALVVWLALVFFSVVEGLEKGWIDKLTALTAPIRVTPTDDYYRSFYYRVDSLSESSNYTPRTIAEKLAAEESNPYNPEVDPEIPANWPKPEKDLVKELFQSIESVRLALDLEPMEFSANDYEVAVGNLRLKLIRDGKEPLLSNEAEQRFLTQTSYLYSFEENNRQLRKTMKEPSVEDLNNLVHSLAQLKAEPEQLQEQLHALFDHITISAIKPEGSFFALKRQLLPPNLSWQALAVMRNGRVEKVFIPEKQKKMEWLSKELLQQGMATTAGTLSFDTAKKTLLFTLSKGASVPLPEHIPLTVSGELIMEAQLVPSSLEQATHLNDLRFSIKLPIQKTILEDTVPFQKMELALANPEEYLDNAQPSHSPFWLYYTANEEGLATPHLPGNLLMGEGILMPKSFRDNGVLLGDRGYLSYYSPTMSSVQEQRVPVYVAGFYDPGIIPIGGKFVTVNRRLTSLLQSNQQQEAAQSNGVAVRFEDLSLTKRIKSLLNKELKNRGIGDYWKVESYQEYDFTREIVQQLRSERNLFSLISLIIILVACSNIISMLIILVNDKKIEIGVLRAMGATSKQIATIFGLCGLVMGTIGSLIGTAAACLTLRYLPSLLGLLGKLQGFDVLNKNFYGEVLPNHLSLYALGLVLGSTVVLSLLAGIIPALKAAMIAPARVLRQE